MKAIKDLKQGDAVYVLRNDGTMFQTTATLVGATNDVSRRLFLLSGGAFSLYLFDEWWCDGVGNIYFCDIGRLRQEVKRQIKEHKNVLANLKALAWKNNAPVQTGEYSRKSVGEVKSLGQVRRNS